MSGQGHLPHPALHIPPKSNTTEITQKDISDQGFDVQKRLKFHLCLTTSLTHLSSFLLERLGKVDAEYRAELSID